MNKEELMGKKVGVLMGGLSAEREVSLQTGKAVMEALAGKGYRVLGLDLGAEMARQILEAEIQVAFVALHGRWGRRRSCAGGFWRPWASHIQDQVCWPAPWEWTRCAPAGYSSTMGCLCRLTRFSPRRMPQGGSLKNRDLASPWW